MKAFFEQIPMKLKGSTPIHRNSQTAITAVTVLQSLASIGQTGFDINGNNVTVINSNPWNPAIQLPAKIAQLLISAHSVLITDTSNTERFIHILQAAIASTQIGLEITLVFKGGECAALGLQYCNALWLCSLIYSGIQTPSWMISHIYPSTDQNNNDNPPAIQP